MLGPVPKSATKASRPRPATTTQHDDPRPTSTSTSGSAITGLCEAMDQTGQHRADTGGIALDCGRTGFRASLEDHDEIAGGGHLADLAATLNESLALLGWSFAVGPLGQQQHGVRG